AASVREDADGARGLCDRGVAFVPERPADARAMRAAVAPVYRQLESDARTRAFVNEIEALKRQTTAEPVPRCRRASAAPVQAVTSPLDGTWEMQVKRADLVGNPAYKLLGQPHAGHPSDQDLQADEGTYRMTFHAGRVSSLQRHPTGDQPAETGTFEVHG